MKQSLFALALFYLLATTACNTSEDRETEAVQALDTLTLHQGEATLYFKTKPKWVDTIPNVIDSFLNGYASEILFAMKEPLLRDYKGSREIYRFTWLRTFDPPVVIRLEKLGNTIRLFSKMANRIRPSISDPLIQDTVMMIEKAAFD